MIEMNQLLMNIKLILKMIYPAMFNLIIIFDYHAQVESIPKQTDNKISKEKADRPSKIKELFDAQSEINHNKSLILG